MNDKDKQIVKDCALSVADLLASQIPGLSFAWDLSKALLGAGLKLRQQRALEWVEMVRDNPGIFAEDLLKQDEFQDAFVFSLEKFVRERSTRKRTYIKNIFLGFCYSEQKDEYELERYLTTMSSISFEAIELLSYIDANILPEMDAEYVAHGGKIIQRLSEKVEERLGHRKGAVYDSNPLRDAVAELITLGILRSWTESYNNLGGGGSSMHYNLTLYGKRFLVYVKE